MIGSAQRVLICHAVNVRDAIDLHVAARGQCAHREMLGIVVVIWGGSHCCWLIVCACRVINVNGDGVWGELTESEWLIVVVMFLWE